MSADDSGNVSMNTEATPAQPISSMSANDSGNVSSNTEAIRARAEACEQLVNQAASGAILPLTFAQRLRETGISSVEAEDYILQFRQRLDRQSSASVPQGTGDHHLPADGPRNNPAPQECTPDGLGAEERDEFRRQRDALEQQHQPPIDQHEVLDDIAWAILRAKLSQLEGLSSNRPQGFRHSQFSEELADLLGLSRPTDSSSIPSSVLAAAPHLAKLSATSKSDPHLDATQKL